MKPLQTAALVFADASTRTVSIPVHVTENLRTELRNWVVKETSGLSEDEVKGKVDDLFVEASLVVATYNMVSRLLLAVDVAGSSDDPVPWPLDRKEVSFTRDREDELSYTHESFGDSILFLSLPSLRHTHSTQLL